MSANAQSGWKVRDRALRSTARVYKCLSACNRLGVYMKLVFCSMDCGQWCSCQSLCHCVIT